MAQCNTILPQMLKLIPRHHYCRPEREDGTGRPACLFSRWHQLVRLIFRQVTSRACRRDGVAALKARFNNLYHLGVKPVARSTFDEAQKSSLSPDRSAMPATAC
jgi:hypothetical protein